ncbi:hypothetical protein [Nitrosospira briensis]|uniref:hypothetical protein n=1 Tax=Nitrosospira briensis TaxID=35799 RepID=UPI0004691016|nr:hypothetical protein [Nitrosospira briensis]
MIIQPVLAPTLDGLTATPALKSNLLKWSALNDPRLFGAEVWASKTNDRASASRLATVYDNSFTHANDGETWYYWIRAVSIYGRSDGEWFPLSATAGVSSTALLVQTTDMALNAVTNLEWAQDPTAHSQTSYSTWERIFLYSYLGTGNDFVIEMQHLANLSIGTIGTSQSANAQQRLMLTENTIYNEGTVTVTNGSAIVTGNGTSWLSNISAGGLFLLPGKTRYLIASVDSNTQITLSTAYLSTGQSGVTYYVIKSASTILTLNQITDRFTISGTYCLTHTFPFRYRIPVNSVAGKLYDITLDWALVRDNTSWSINNLSVVKTLILEEIKR